MLPFAFFCKSLSNQPGPDKKFCDSSCKDAYINEIKGDERGEINKIDLILKRNRRVLKKLSNPKKADLKISREMLIRAGFEFVFLTHVVITSRKGNEITFCYDYGYMEVSENKFQIYPSFSRVHVKGGYTTKVN